MTIVALEPIIRSWCETLARDLASDTIEPDGIPYLRRYYVAGWQPGTKERAPAIYLHHFLGSDPQATVHSHPWHAQSLILVGSYREHRCSADGRALQVRDYHAGDVNILAPDDWHRIELLTPDVWTLLLRGPFAQPWGFQDAC